MARPKPDPRPEPARRPAAPIGGRPRPLLRQSMTIVLPDDPDSAATLEVVALSPGCTFVDCPGADARSLPDFPELEEAGWQGTSVGYLDIYWRLVV